MVEEWKDVVGYEGYYQVSNFGNLRSVDRYARVCGGGQRLVKGKPIKPIVCSNGYLEAAFSKSRVRKVFLLHRLVAMHFIDNPDNLPEVNHKDENIKNCRADNLEWCTSKYNANYGTRNKRCRESSKKYDKPVYQMDLQGNILKKWDCLRDACRATGADASSMIRVCKGRQNTSVGYKWQYA